MTDRSVIVQLAEPPWAHPQDEQRWRAEVLEPVLDALVASSRPVGLVLGGRLSERLQTLDEARLLALRAAIDSQRVQLVATPLHGACLSSIPARDAIGQLRAHITLSKRVFGVRPTGCWLPAASWDPTLPRILQKAGLRWTVLDDTWLESIGAPRARVLAVERDGHAVAILRGRRDGTGTLQLAHPCTLDDVPAVLDALQRPAVALSVLLAGGRARAYLPSGGPDGIWENRLLEDAGADVLHKCMHRVSRAVERLRRGVDATAHADTGPDPMRLEQAVRYLYRAQSAVAYGGPTCTTATRDRAWRDLLRAEGIAEEELQTPVPRCTVSDLDCDGHDEVRLRSENWSATLAPASAGTVIELSRRGDAVNILAGLLPMAFRETFDDGRPVAGEWELVTAETPGDGVARAILVADSTIDGVPVRVTKGIQLGASGPFNLRLEVSNRGMDAARGRLSTEVFLALGGLRFTGDTHDPLTVELAGGREPLDEVVKLPPVDAVGIAGWRARVDLEIRPPASVLIEPLVDGLARLELSWPVELFARDRERREVNLSVREAPDG